MNDALDMSHQGTFPLDLRTKIPIKTTWMGMNNVTQKTNVSNTWTTSSKTSGKGKLRNSKHSPISFQSSTSTHQEPRKPRMLLSNITQEHSMRLKPLLLQQLSEGNTQLSDCETTLTTPNKSRKMETTLLTNSSPRLAGNQTNLSEISHQDEQTQMAISMNLPTKSVEFSNQRCLGLTMKKKLDELVTRIVKNPAESLDSSLATTRSSDNGSRTREQHHLDFPPLSGTTSSRDKPSTLMQYSHHCTIFPLLKRTLDAWEQLRSPLDAQRLPRGSKRVVNGQAPGMPPSKRPNSLSLAKKKNSGNMENTSKVTSQLKSPPLTAESSSTISQSVMRSEVDKTRSSPIHIDSLVSTLPSSCLMESNLNTHKAIQSDPPVKQTKMKYATVSTLSMGAETQPMIAASNMHAKSANGLATEKSIAIAKKELVHELRPRNLRYNIWEGGSHFSHSSADWSETALPLPSIPTSELNNPIVTKTIKENPHLFDIITPIFIDQFENLLNSHPNQAFIKSVCQGLREGFWPWADTHYGEYPDTLDLSLPEPVDKHEAQFL